MSFIASTLFNRQILQGDEDTTNIIVQAEFDGRLKEDEGFLSATGTLCSITAAASKDLYLSAAKVNFHLLAGSAAVQDVVIELQVNGTVVETCHGVVLSTANGYGEHEFKNLWHKVDATQVLRLEVTTIDANVDVEGTIQAVEVPDGANPVTYTD